MPPRLVKTIYLTIDGDTFAALVNEVRIQYPKPVVEHGLAPGAVYSEVPAGEAKLVINGIQDHEDANGICVLLEENQGKIGTFVFSPRAAGTAYRSVQAVIQAPEFGGVRNQFGKFQLTLDCVTDPVPVTPPAGES